jgi:sugar lactone lactonase YvrE
MTARKITPITRKLFVWHPLLALAVILFFQVGLSANAFAACGDNGTDPAKCQWEEDTSGDIWGTPVNTAPQPSFSSTNPACTSMQCSDGIHQDAGTINILYDTNYNASGPSTTCRFVDNHNGNNIFVPQNSLTEFTEFVKNAPTGVTFGYCVQAQDLGYKATATMGNGCEIFAANGPVTCPPNVGPAKQNVSLDLPVVRVTDPPAEVNLPVVTFAYTRKDCRNDVSGAPVCLDHAIVETDTILAKVVANPSDQCRNPQSNLNVNCDGTWQVTATASCTVDGVPAPTCLSNFAPPPPRLCTVDGVTHADGTTWNVAITPIQGCPGKPGTPDIMQCTDGTIGVQSAGAAEVIDNCPVSNPVSLYVVDKNNDRVQVFDLHGKFLYQYGAGHGSGDGQFVEAYGIHFDSNNQAMITDSGNARVQIFSALGVFNAKFGSYGSNLDQFLLPDEVAQAPDGTIWVTDITANTVSTFAAGNYLPGFVATNFFRPTGVAFDKAGSTWVINSGSNTIKKLDAHGNTVFEFGSPGSGPGQFNFAWDLQFDTQDRMWVADSGNDRVQVFDDNGKYLFQFGTTGAGNGQFQLPIDLAIDPSGNVWVSDQGNNRVEQFDSTGKYLFQFGGAGSNAGQFLAPVGITVH